ncbi:MAG: DoxX family protein [Patescibacteria group bacterium]
MPSLFPQLFDFEQLAPLILRAVLGVVFIVHGFPKLFKNYSQTVSFFESVGLKPGKVWVFISGGVEFFGGIFLVIGLFVQPVTFLIAVNMAVALFWVKIHKSKAKFSNGYEFDLVLLIALATLLFLGAGALALDLPL